MSKKVSNEVGKVVNGCKVCQKFAKLVSRPKITLPKSSTFNEVVILDLKSFDQIIICGKVIHNKGADIVINILTDTWISCFGIPSVGFYSDNEGEFVNVKMDKLVQYWASL